MKIRINKKLTIDTKKPPLIVAEISANHNGSKKNFLKLIKQASMSGADIVKIQTYEPQDMTLNSNKKIFRLKKGLWKNKFLFDLYKKSHTPFSWHKDAFNFARKNNINLFSSPFSIRAVQLLEKLNVSIYKIASLEITDFSLIDRIAQCNKPIIVSTGCATIKEIQNCVRLIKKYHNKIILLHSVTSYPTLDEDANIKKIDYLKKKFKNIPVGLSDHTNDITSSIAASALGVVMIEKHFASEKIPKTLDNKFSIGEKKFMELKKMTSKIFNLLNSDIKFNTPNKDQRRSLFAKTDIKKGQKFNKENFISLRPKIGICSSKYFEILNKTSKKNVKKGEPIRKNAIKNF